jgi:hypothetical protein
VEELEKDDKIRYFQSLHFVPDYTTSNSNPHPNSTL